MAAGWPRGIMAALDVHPRVAMVILPHGAADRD
jgi:hypothetical protein